VAGHDRRVQGKTKGVEYDVNSPAIWSTLDVAVAQSVSHLRCHFVGVNQRLESVPAVVTGRALTASDALIGLRPAANDERLPLAAALRADFVLGGHRLNVPHGSQSHTLPNE
jgi:hypothetical protein